MRPKAFLLLVILLLLSPLSSVHALYTVTLPSNTYYADDFENYTTTTCTATTNTAAGVDNGVVTGCLPGWAYVDNNCNAVGDRAVNQTYAYSPTHSLSMTSAKAAAKCDMDKRIVIHNSTSLVQMSVWFIVTNTILSANNRGSVVADTGAHIALEYWDATTHWEAVTFIIANGCGSIASAIAVDFVGDGASGLNQGTDHCGQHLIRTYDYPTDGSAAYWHHLTVTINVLTHKWVHVELDDDSYDYLMAGHNLRSLADSAWANVGTLTGVRVEFAVIGPTTFTSSDKFFLHVDDLQITDASPGSPNIVQLAIFNSAYAIAAFSGIFGLVTGLWWIHEEFKGQHDPQAIERKKEVVKLVTIFCMVIAVIFFIGGLVTGP